MSMEEALPSVKPPPARARFGVTRVEVSGFRNAREFAYLRPGATSAAARSAHSLTLSLVRPAADAR